MSHVVPSLPLYRTNQSLSSSASGGSVFVPTLWWCHTLSNCKLHTAYVLSPTTINSTLVSDLSKDSALSSNCHWHSLAFHSADYMMVSMSRDSGFLRSWSVVAFTPISISPVVSIWISTSPVVTTSVSTSPVVSAWISTCDCLVGSAWVLTYSVVSHLTSTWDCLVVSSLESPLPTTVATTVPVALQLHSPRMTVHGVWSLDPPPVTWSPVDQLGFCTDSSFFVWVWHVASSGPSWAQHNQVQSAQTVQSPTNHCHT